MAQKASCFLRLILACCTALVLARAATGGAERAPSATSVDTLLTRGEKAFATHDFAAAESLAKAAVEIARQAPGKDSLALCDSYALLSRVYGAQGRYAEPDFRRFAEEAAGIAERHRGPDHAETLYALRTLGVGLWQAGDLTAALPVLQRIYDTRLRTLGPDSLETGHAARNLGGLQWQIGNYAAAETLMAHAERVYEHVLGPRAPDTGDQLHNLAALRWAQGNYEAAESLETHALEIRQSVFGKDQGPVLQSLMLLGEVKHELGDYRSAIEINERVVAAMRAQGASLDSAAFAMTLGNLGTVREEMGDLEEAEKLQREALQVQERSLGRDHPYVAMTLVNLANIADDRDEYAAAQPLYERAAAIDAKASGPDSPDVASDLDNLANCRDLMGDYAAGDSLHRRVIAIREKTLGPNSPQMADALDKYARALAAQGKLAAALQMQRRILGIRSSVLGPAHPLVAAAWHQIAETEWAQGSRDSALAHTLRAEQISRDHLRLTMRALPEQQALHYAESRVNGLDLAVAAGLESRKAGDLRAIWDAVVRSRAVVLDEMARRAQESGAGGDTATIRLSHELAAARKLLADLIVRGPDDGDTLGRYQRSLAEAQDNKRKAEESFAVHSDAFRHEQGDVRAGLQEVQRELPGGFALVAYLRYESEGRLGGGRIPRVLINPNGAYGGGQYGYAAFVLSSSKADPVLVDLGSATRIDSMIAAWQGAIRHPPAKDALAGAGLEAYREVAGPLRSAIWDPLRSRLASASDVLVVPDGDLNLVSLASLPVGDAGYLVEQSPAIHYLSAERDVATRSEQRASSGGLLALGDPDFDAHGGAAVAPGEFRGARSACGDFQTVRFPPLSATREEVGDLAARWKTETGAETELVGADASEARFKREAPGKSVLHLATHGFFLGEQCGAEAGETRGIGRIATAAAKPKAEETENPLLRAGLALAGANRRQDAKPDEDDGILTAEEISALDLHAADWAVLSACETGVGTVRAGEGVFGLRRAFEIAGARTLIMSLWPVEDQSAREWMDRLYDARLTAHASTVGAVRQASLEVLKERRARGESTHPFYWGAFVAAGDWR